MRRNVGTHFALDKSTGNDSVNGQVCRYASKSSQISNAVWRVVHAIVVIWEVRFRLKDDSSSGNSLLVHAVSLLTPGKRPTRHLF